MVHGPGERSLSSSAAPAPAATSKKAVRWDSDTVRRAWLCDTGCPFDLTSRKNLPRSAHEDIFPAAEPASLETANGRVEVNEQVTLAIDGLLEQVEPFLMEDSPDVLNIGSRCELQGFSFHWEPFSKHPYFVMPKSSGGKKVILTSIDQCPYLIDRFNTDGGGMIVDSKTFEPVACPGVRRRDGAGDDDGDEKDSRRVPQTCLTWKTPTAMVMNRLW